MLRRSVVQFCSAPPVHFPSALDTLPGAHEGLVSEDVYQTVQGAMRRNSGRSRTLQQRPQREYLLKGLIQCAHCRMPMWAQTFKNGRRYYREQKGSRGAGYCVGRSGSMPGEVPDEQMGRIISAIVLPEAWLDRVLAQVHGADEVKRVERARDQIQQRLKRLGTAYVDGMYDDAEYRRQKRVLDDKLRSLVVPDADVAAEAGKLLEHLPELWGKRTSRSAIAFCLRCWMPSTSIRSMKGALWPFARGQHFGRCWRSRLCRQARESCWCMIG